MERSGVGQEEDRSDGLLGEDCCSVNGELFSRAPTYIVPDSSAAHVCARVERVGGCCCARARARGAFRVVLSAERTLVYRRCCDFWVRMRAASIILIAGGV